MDTYGTKSSKADYEVDLEAGGNLLYPGIGYGENQLRWGFIRKVYGILSAQILLTTLVSAIIVLYEPANQLLRGNSSLLLFLCILPFVLLWPLHVYQQKHPHNFIFLGLFTTSLSLTVGVSCAQTDGRIVLEALFLTSAVVLGLTGYTFWAAKKGHDFSFLGPILFTSLFIIILTGFMQVRFCLTYIFGTSYFCRVHTSLSLTLYSNEPNRRLIVKLFCDIG
ncbi:OLC1v1020237C1 [Oldenlandia corymbosa var. corymbosa]|uniref:OLC1v1020237C1 n=1 Tax=Oldenlandia corymbosa var. corymbosa TaxID=529605 RepID=A0AAV1EFW2_OLDCO|nr:OLC1v1020237C1 [Oldenlandia corymbosa var. corymbosa]